MTVDKLRIISQKIFVVIPYRLRKHDNLVVGIVFDDSEAEFVEIAPQVAEVASAMKQYNCFRAEALSPP